MPTTYTITVSDRDEQVLEWIVRQTNAERGTAMTTADFMQQRFKELITPFVLRYIEAEKAAVAAAFGNTNDPAIRASVKTTLNVSI
jgi:hypothetical protein